MTYIDSNFKINLLRGSHICQTDHCVAKDDLEFMILLPQCWDGTPGVYDRTQAFISRQVKTPSVELHPGNVLSVLIVNR